MQNPDNIIELWPDNEHNEPARIYLIRTTRTTPDDHYFQAAGEEPPLVKRGLWFHNNVELTVMLSFIAVMLVVLVLWPVGV